jgi:hypothetical protein
VIQNCLVLRRSVSSLYAQCASFQLLRHSEEKGGSWVTSPAAIQVSFYRIMEPQSAVSSWILIPRKDKAEVIRNTKQ